MSTKTTKKEVLDSYSHVIRVLHGYAQNLLKDTEPIAYTETAYGIGADIYPTKFSDTVIATGSNPFGYNFPSFITRKYDNFASKLKSSDPDADRKEIQDMYVSQARKAIDGKEKEVVREEYAKSLNMHYESLYGGKVVNFKNENDSWNSLTPFLKESNLDSARSYLEEVKPKILKTVEKREDLLDLVEELSKNEHFRWATFHYENGYTHGEVKDRDKKTHPDLAPLPEGKTWKDLDKKEKENVLSSSWAALSTETKDKDKESINAFLSIEGTLVQDQSIKEFINTSLSTIPSHEERVRKHGNISTKDGRTYPCDNIFVFTPNDEKMTGFSCTQDVVKMEDITKITLPENTKEIEDHFFSKDLFPNVTEINSPIGINSFDKALVHVAEKENIEPVKGLKR